MLIAGSDVSGSDVDGQRRFIGFVIGTAERINSIFNNLEMDRLHMSRLDEDEREHVRNTLDFSANDIMAWCFNVEKQNIIDYIYNHQNLRPKNRYKKKIYDHFDRLLLRMFRSELEDFTFSHSSRIEDLNVQCDKDTRDTIRVWHMNPNEEGRVYDLSDAIAWCNERNFSLDGCIERDFGNELKNEMEIDLLK